MYTIEIEGKLVFKQSEDDIELLKDNATLKICYISGRNQTVVWCNYVEFIARAPQRRLFIDLPPSHESDFDDNDDNETFGNSFESAHLDNSISSINTDIMADTKLKFLNTAGALLKPFSGNPDELDAFIRNINLIEQCADGDLKPSHSLRVESRAQ